MLEPCRNGNIQGKDAPDPQEIHGREPEARFVRGFYVAGSRPGLRLQREKGERVEILRLSTERL